MKIILTECQDCGRETNQKVLFSKTVKGFHDYDDEVDTFYYMVTECAGCNNISFLVREPVDETDIEFIDMVFPGHRDCRTKFDFIKEEDQEQLPNDIYFLYDEVKAAFKSDSCILAGVGLRTLVEAICLQQKITGNNLSDKIKKLNSTGLISTSEMPILDKLRLIGNQSTHQIKSFPVDKLSYALEIINHVLKSIYILPKINRKLRIKQK